jgi:hypothetical protein
MVNEGALGLQMALWLGQSDVWHALQQYDTCGTHRRVLELGSRASISVGVLSSSFYELI